ncbi:MAG TPA: GNAT family N-acetyltransferase [Candidatus Binatus sp.]|nr:GNAT family N-acetyltransferase [Candidatus Binatus sp.]
MAIRIERPSTVGDFLARAGAYLGDHEAEHNLIFALTSTLTTNPEVYPLRPLFAVAVEEDHGQVVAAAMQTPPHNLVLAEVADAAAVPALAQALARESLPGVLGPSAAAAEFAVRWSGAAGRRTHRAMAERIYRCARVIPPRPAEGSPRIAAAPDRELLIEWLRAFNLEAGVSSVEAPEVMADRWIGHVGGRTMWLWEAGRRVVSASGVSGPTPHGIRVGPVYTPRSDRGRGYASNLVAAATQAQLDAGKTFVFLFTDLANPTSNRVYQAIGYEPVADVDYWAFDPPD